MKTRFNVELYEGANEACIAAVKTAAYVNGGEYKLDLPSIAKMAEAERCQDTTVELITDSLLHIDVKFKGEWKTVCRIEAVEIAELKETINDLQEVF